MAKPLAGNGLRILVADDNPINQRVAVGMLKQMGLQAEIASNGGEALQALNAAPFDLVFMDVQMPVMDGLAAARQIRQAEFGSSRRIPIIAMTASAMEGDRENCLEAGMDDFIAKPVVPSAMAQVLAKWLPQSPAGAPPGEPPAPVFDRTGLLERLMGDRELADRILKGYLENIPGQLEALRKSVETGSLRDAAGQAHKIKGASTTVGCESVRALAAELEIAAESGDTRSLKALAAELDRRFLRLKNSLAA
jgi:CheY-like chemotaxis protein/HPt (histidine-containing phosphotransfer) domain-containing protein